jgi:hypothetical protein
MVARAGDSLQHASPCFAGPTMCSPFSLCDRRRRVEETTHARSGTIRPPVPEHGRRRSCLRRGRGWRAIARRGVSRSPAKQEAGSSWPVFRLAGGRRAGAGRSELWRRPACRLAHDLGRTELRGVTVSRARWRGCKREALPVDPLELGHAGVR